MNMLDVVEGRLVTHAHDDNWRLRDMVKHPRDPGWESGRYSACHKLFRNNGHLKPNTIVFDLVRPKGKKFPVVRSAFVIREIINGTVYFDSFFFADGEPIEIKRRLYRTSYGIKITKDKSIELLEEMKANSYNEYRIGEKPKSISTWDWERMKLAITNSMGRKHMCY